jgi:hypothetical protein
MAKTFDIIMAGTISGIVALTTTYLGLGGTVIGAVLGSIIYQILSIFLKEPLEKKNLRKLENEIVYVIPLVLIAILLIIFILSYFYADFTSYYLQLRDITENNLLTLMGIGLIAMGIYPLFQSKNIKKIYGIIILVLGGILLLRGILPFDPILFEIYDVFDGPYDILSTIVLIGLIFTIFKILIESINSYNKSKIIIAEEEKTIEYLCETKLNNTLKKDKTSTMFENQEFFEKKEKKKKGKREKKKKG